MPNLTVFVIHSPTHGSHEVTVPSEVSEYVLALRWHLSRVPQSRPGVLYVMRGGRGCGKTLLHRFVWEKLGLPAARYLDHVDGNPLNNALDNLRPATASLNQFNKRVPANNTSGVKGVAWSPGKRVWRAQITVDGRRIYLGSSADKAKAIEARRRGEERFYGSLAVQPGARLTPVNGHVTMAVPGANEYDYAEPQTTRPGCGPCGPGEPLERCRAAES